MPAPERRQQVYGYDVYVSVVLILIKLLRTEQSLIGPTTNADYRSNSADSLKLNSPCVILMDDEYTHPSRPSLHLGYCFMAQDLQPGALRSPESDTAQPDSGDYQPCPGKAPCS